MQRINLFTSAVLTATLLFTSAAHAESINAGDRPYTKTRPFKVETIATFDTPWRIAFLPDGRMLVTERRGRLYLATPKGQKTEVGNVPAVAAQGQNGMLDVVLAPDYATSSKIYLTYVEPGAGGSRLVLAMATLSKPDSSPALSDLKVIWRQTPDGGGGQPGGIVAFDPDAKHLFLTVGDRMQAPSAQDPMQARGKVIRLNLDGSTPPDNPHAAEGGIPAETWTTGHRNPYGLAFAPDGKLWMHEMGPKGGDEFNLIEAGKNYGWPIVSNGDNYDGTPIPRHSTHPEFAPPALYWNPVIAPAGLVFYEGDMFAKWRGSALICGLKSRALVRVAFRADGQPDEAERWDMGARIRDVAVASDGAVWLIEDGSSAKLLRLTPER